MRKAAPTALWAALCAFGLCLSGEGAEVAARIADPPRTGAIELTLYDSPAAFGDLRDPVNSARFPADGRAVYRLENVEPGEYALLVHHDRNDNGSIDKNFIGIPREPLGLSNGYRPKGPPSFRRAAFVLAEGESRTFDVALAPPLGDRGRLGVGLGVIGRSSPYRGYNGAVYQVIPALTYNGSRVQILGPAVRVGLVGSDRVRLAATGQYRIGVYEESESDVLAGLGDRESTFTAGLALQAELKGGVDLSVSYEHDVLDRIGGGTGRLAVDRSFPVGLFRFSPELAVNRVSARMADHDFGVPTDRATPERPAYELDSTVGVELGLGAFVELSRDWLIVMRVAVERLDPDVTGSPIVGKDYVVSGFAAVNAVF